MVEKNPKHSYRQIYELTTTTTSPIHGATSPLSSTPPTRLGLLFYLFASSNWTAKILCI